MSWGRLAGAVAAWAALAAAGLPAQAELLGTVAGRQGTVRLMTEGCRLPQARRDGEAKRAYRLEGGARVEGCWVVDARGHPAVTWRDGRRETLDGDRVRLQRKYAALLEEAPAAAPPRPPAAPRPTTAPRPPVDKRPATASRPPVDARAAAPPSSPARPRASADFPRPSWCRSARLMPHERQVCSDARLAAQDLALAPLWREFRTRERLTPAAEAWHKSSYFGRLKACGSDRSCIDREQRSRRRFYEQALGRSATG